MGDENLKISQVINARNAMLQREKELYIAAIEKININTRELLKNDFGNTLVKNCARDIAGEVVRRYFDMGNYYITVDQMYDRIINFSYDKDIDLLSNDEPVRKAYYNIEDSSFTSETLHSIQEQCDVAQKQLFDNERSKDNLDKKGKEEYRKAKLSEYGKLYDEITGQEGSYNTINKNGKEILVSDLHADHIQARESIKYNERYITEDKIQKLKEFYNSVDNMQMIHASANTSKGDVRVCEIDGKIEYLNSKEFNIRNNKGEKINDITHRATADQLVEATVSQWEKETKYGNKMAKLKEKGYLDENGKVKKEVKEELKRNIIHSQNMESKEILKSTNYKNVSKDSGKQTARSMKKIIAGQVIYYVLPPLVFETQNIIKRKNITLEKFFSEVKKAGSRVVKYVVKKLDEVFKNVLNSSVSTFIKTFFDIIIGMVKATVKRFIKMVKQIVMSLVNSMKILCDKTKTSVQKADAITKTLSIAITGVVMELLFEYLEKQFALRLI